MSEERVVFSQGGQPDHELQARHVTIAENISLVVELMAELDGLRGSKAAMTRQLVNEGQALLWTVGDPGKIDFLVAAGYILPDPETKALIPAIVADASSSVLLAGPRRWSSETLRLVQEAIINLPSAYEAALGFKLYRRLERDEFFALLSLGDPSRQQIRPIWDLIRPEQREDSNLK